MCTLGFKCFRFEISNGVPIFDIALLKLIKPAAHKRVIELCTVDRDVMTMLDLLSLGATSVESRKTLTELHDVSFFESVFKYASIWSLEICPEYNICALPIIPGTQLCYGDGGSPLYRPKCGNVEKCLMGVASYSHVCSNGEHWGRGLECSSGIYFANIPFFRQWIEQTIFYN